MDLSFSEKDRAFQAEVRGFLDEAWPQEMRDKQSRSALGKLSKEDCTTCKHAVTECVRMRRANSFAS